MNKSPSTIAVAALHLVSVHHHGGHAGDQIDALAQDVLQTQILGVLIVRVKAQHAALQLIHDIGRGERRRRIAGVEQPQDCGVTSE